MMHRKSCSQDRLRENKRLPSVLIHEVMMTFTALETGDWFKMSVWSEIIVISGYQPAEQLMNPHSILENPVESDSVKEKDMMNDG